MKISTHELRFVLLSAALFIAGCDPGYQIKGRVTSSATGAPIAGATVQAVCANPPAPSATSDASGNINGADMGFFAEDCRIEVSAKGFTTQTFTVASVCRKRHLGSCLHIEVNATLAPATP